MVRIEEPQRSWLTNKNNNGNKMTTRSDDEVDGQLNELQTWFETNPNLPEKIGKTKCVHDDDAWDRLGKTPDILRND